MQGDVWVVDRTWTVVSNLHGKLLDPSLFVAGNEDGEANRRRRHALSNNNPLPPPGLLASHAILLFGSFPQFAFPPISATSVLTACGAEVALDVERFRELVSSGRTGVCLWDEEGEPSADARETTMRLGLPLTSCRWLTDCLEGCAVQPAVSGCRYDMRRGW